MIAYVTQKKLIDGLAIGVLREGKTLVCVAGAGITADSVFEIGSITKLFTIEALDALVGQGRLRWDDNLSHFLAGSADRVNGAEAGAEKETARGSTLLDVAMHRSGLPLMPENLGAADPLNPLGSYTAEDLENYFRLVKPELFERSENVYSNLGFALLGYIASQVSGESFAKLMQDEVLSPNGLTRSYLATTGRASGDLLQGHGPSGKPVPRWVQDAFSPAGALCSTVGDMLKWMQNRFDDSGGFEAKNLAEASDKVYLGWGGDGSESWLCRYGTTGGFSSFLGVRAEKRTGVVLLANRQCLLLMRALADNCMRSIDGRPVAALRGRYRDWKFLLLEPLRSVKRKTPVLQILWNRIRYGRLGRSKPTPI